LDFAGVNSFPGCESDIDGSLALPGTVLENVALAISLEFIDNSLVWEALEPAQLSTFLQESRDVIDTVVGENGAGVIRWSTPTPGHRPRPRQPAQVTGTG